MPGIALQVLRPASHSNWLISDQVFAGQSIQLKHQYFFDPTELSSLLSVQTPHHSRFTDDVTRGSPHEFHYPWLWASAKAKVTHELALPEPCAKAISGNAYGKPFYTGTGDGVSLGVIR